MLLAILAHAVDRIGLIGGKPSPRDPYHPKYRGDHRPCDTLELKR